MADRPERPQNEREATEAIISARIEALQLAMEDVNRNAADLNHNIVILGQIQKALFDLTTTLLLLAMGSALGWMVWSKVARK